jgi:hypothetical protein
MKQLHGSCLLIATHADASKLLPQFITESAEAQMEIVSADATLD